MLCRVVHGEITPILNKDEIKIPGMHNVDNFLTAIAAVGTEVSDDAIRKVAREFGGVEHRIEYVRTVHGIRYYNDSIASSPTRTIAGLRAFAAKIIVLAGGYDKHIPYAPLGPELCTYSKAVILLGATAPKIEEAIRSAENYKEGEPAIYRVNTLEEAVALSQEIGESGDVVSLSPASASFDLYKNFEERGRHFKAIVRALTE